MFRMRAGTFAISIILIGCGSLRIAEAQPVNAGSLCARIASHFHSETDPAVRACAALRHDPHNPNALNDLGVSLAHRKMYADAISAYRLSLAASTHLPEVETNLGIAYFRMGNLKSAITSLRRALAANPADLQARTLLGMAFYGARNYTEAASQLEQVASAEPRNVRLQFILAECYLLSRQTQKTLEEFQKIEESEPQSVAAYMLFGQVLDGLGRFDQAIQEFQKAESADPNTPNIHFVLGYLYWKRRLFEQAAAEFHRELAGDPANAEAHAYLGDISYRSGSLTTARGLLRQALAEGAHIRLIYLDLGIIDTSLKNYPASIRELQKAVALDPTQTDAHYRLALAYNAAGDGAAAGRELQIINEMQTENRAVSRQEVMGQSPSH